MSTKTVTITRKNRNIGYGHYFIDGREVNPPPSAPNHRGTLRQVYQAIREDPYLDLNGFRVARWMIQIDGTWYPIRQESVSDLYMLREGFVDSVTITVNLP